jgi:integrase
LEQKGTLPRNPADFANVPQVDASAPRDTEGDDDDKDHDDADSSSKAMEEVEAQAFLMAAKALADEQDRNGDHEHLIPERCWSALWHVLLGSGLRPGEAFALQWKNVDVEDVKAAEVKVRRNLVRVRGTAGYQLLKPKTKKSKRTVPLPESAAEELKRWKKKQLTQRMLHANIWQDSGFVFTTSKGTPLHGARRAFERVCSKANLGKWGEEPKREHATGPLPARKFNNIFRIYDLRHTFATLALANAVPVNVVSDWLGHENPAFTYAKYGHALKKDTAAATVTMQGVLFRAG